MMEKKMKKTERRMSTRIVPDSVEPAVIRYSPCSTEPLLPAVFLMQPANNRVPEEAKDEDNVLLDVARLVDKKIIEAEQREAERNSRSSHSKAAIASSLALLASVLLIVAVLIWHEAPPERGPDPMCETSDCLRFAFIIGQSMDRSADACAAFGTFVCGGARLPDMHSWMPEARDNLLHSWTNDVIESLNAPKVGDSAGRILDNARAMLQSCLETACDETISQRNARDLRIFLEQRKLSWPGDPQRSDVHPLDVLLDLAINWQMPLWFNVGILTTSVTPTAQASALRVDFNMDSTRWWMPAGTTYRSRNSLTSSTTTRIGEEVIDDEEVGDTNAYHFDSYVFSTLSKLASGYSAGLEPSALDLLGIEALTPHLEMNVWILFLQRHMRTTMTISESTQVLLADRRLLTTTDHFFAKFFWEELLDHMSRSVVNAFANVIYSATPSSVDNAGTALNDSVPCPTVAIRTRCELQAEYTYRLFLAVNHGEHVGMAARRKHLLVILNEALRAAVAALIRRKNMASEQRHGSTDAAINRLQRIRLDVWPSDELLRISRDELELMYSSFPEPDAAHSYLEHLLATRRALRSLLGSPTYRHLTGIGAQGGRSRDGFFGYDPFENAVFVWPGVLREPLFYARATKAVNYGGVGAAFARQLTAAMDVDEVFFDAE
ncbi:EEF1AKMT4-ECE2 readthrough transcript protein-like isoform X2 [Dermacentor albipictus]